MHADNQPPELMTDDQFAQSVYAKYQEHFDHYHRLLKFAETAFVNYRSLVRDHYHLALMYIVPRALKSFDSIRRLCNVASCEDAAVIVRCLLNLVAVTRWISRDPERRAKKFLAWYWVELYDRVKKHPEKFSEQQRNDIQRRYNTEKSQFEFRNRKGKPEFARHWYEPEVHSIFELFKEVDFGSAYEEAYRDLSGTEHSDVMAFYSMYANAVVKDGERQLAVQSDSLVPILLRAAFQYFADIFAICNKTLGLAEHGPFDEMVQAGMSFYRKMPKPSAAS